MTGGSLTAAEAGASAAAARPARRPGQRRAARRRRRFVLLCLSPWIIGFTVFFAYPLIGNIYLSLTSYDLLSSPRWVGFANYEHLFTVDKQVWPAVRNSLWIIGIAIPLQVLFAFGVALMLTRARRGVGIFRTIFYLPALAPQVAATLGFAYLLNPGNGPVNAFLGLFGIEGPLWFDSPAWAKPSLALLGMWAVGNTMVIFLAALLDVPKQLYESAELDGAGGLRQLRFVTLPSISPVILFATVIGVIEGLQYFTQAYVASLIVGGAGNLSALNLGYPEDSTLFYPILLYQQGFRYFHMGYAAAMSMLLLVVALAVTLVILRRSKGWVHTAVRP